MAAGKPHVLMQSTFLYVLIKLNGVKAMLKENAINPEAYLHVIPIHEAAHWTLLVCITKKNEWYQCIKKVN